MGAVHTQLEVGQLFAGGYRVERPLSAGGMGAVYVVTQLTTQRQRALKVMHPELAQHPKFRDRFRQEAQVGAQIRSEHIVEVVDAGVDADTGMPYLAMELLDGADLADTMERRGPLSREEVAMIYTELCHALGAAHEANIVHRDLKPENLFLAVSHRADGRSLLKILDFGIAKMVAEAKTASRATQSIGSPLWMAPEQTVPGGTINAQTDIWALGLIAFYLLTGRPYWQAANEESVEQMRLLREIAFEPLLPASARAATLGVQERLPAGFDHWFSRCVAREATQRFRSAAEVEAALLPLLRAAPAVTPPLPTHQQLPISPPIQQGPAPVQPPPQHDPTAAQSPILAGGAVSPTMPAFAAPMTVPHTHGAVAPVSASGPMSGAAASSGPMLAPMAAEITAPRRRSPLPWVAGAVAALAVIGGVIVVTTADNETTSSAPIPIDEPAAVAPTVPAEAPSVRPLEFEPAPSSAPSVAEVEPQRLPAPPPKAFWPATKPTQNTGAKTPAPNPPPPPVRPPAPNPAPPTPVPPSSYGRPCKTRADCGPGFDCSYGGKCVHM